MPYLVTQTYFPPNKADEVGKKYLEVIEKYPPDESLGKELIPAALISNKDNIMGMAVTEVKKEKVFDAFDRAAKAQVEYRNIEGYRYKVRIWLTAEEALASIGLG